MNPLTKALAYTGRNRFKNAWLMFWATYWRTRELDGYPDPLGEPLDMSRWYSFCCGLRCAWRYLWRNR